MSGGRASCVLEILREIYCDNTSCSTPMLSVFPFTSAVCLWAGNAVNNDSASTILRRMNKHWSSSSAAARIPKLVLP